MEPPEGLKALAQPARIIFRAAWTVPKAQHPTLGDRESEKGKILEPYLRRAPSGQPWTTGGNGCPELANGQRKPGGDLRFVLADFPRLGSVCRIHTCSYRSNRQIHSALQEIQPFTGGWLAGITAKLTVRPEEA